MHVTSQPRADVVVTLATTSGSLSTQQLTFTSSNWTQPQRVTLTGLRTDQLTTVSVATASSRPAVCEPRHAAADRALELGIGARAFPLGGRRAAGRPAPRQSRRGRRWNRGPDEPVRLRAEPRLAGCRLAGGAALHPERSATASPSRATRRMCGTSPTPPITRWCCPTPRSVPAAPRLREISQPQPPSAPQATLRAQAWVRRDGHDGGDTVIEFSNADGRHRIWLGFARQHEPAPAADSRSSSGSRAGPAGRRRPRCRSSEWNHLAFSIDRDRSRASTSTANSSHGRRSPPASPGWPGRATARPLDRRGQQPGSPARPCGPWRSGMTPARRTRSGHRCSTRPPSGAGLVSSLPLNNSLANDVPRRRQPCLRTVQPGTPPASPRAPLRPPVPGRRRVACRPAARRARRPDGGGHQVADREPGGQRPLQHRRHVGHRHGRTDRRRHGGRRISGSLEQPRRLEHAAGRAPASSASARPTRPPTPRPGSASGSRAARRAMSA